MIFWISIIIVIVSLVGGAYSIILLHLWRKKDNTEAVNSFFYYQIIISIFGIYGILGTHLVSKFLLKFDINLAGIEFIRLFLPFLGIPLIITAWFLLIKTISEVIEKQIPQYITIIYFVITTLFFFSYGLILKKITEGTTLFNYETDQLVRTIYYSFEVFITIVLTILLFVYNFKNRKLNHIGTLRIFTIMFLLIYILKGVALHFSENFLIARIYFILLYFAGNLPLILLLQKYMLKNKNSGNYSDNLLNRFNRYSITSREQQIIIEIQKGKSNQQIADDLYISLQTVKDHIHNIFKKTAIRNRVQLVKLFFQD